MENDLLWTKTILSVYRYLERISGAIDKLVEQNGLKSGNIYASNYLYNNVYSVTQRMIDLSQRKITLINLKVLIEDTLVEIGPENARILIERYFDGIKRKNMAQNHGVSLRTIFRRIESAEQAFSKRLKIKGFDNFEIRAFLIDEGWINNVYARLSTREEEDFCLSNAYLSKAVSM